MKYNMVERMGIMSKFLTILTALFIGNMELNAQSVSQKIDSLIAINFGDDLGPGGVFLVAKQGQILYEKAIGKANIELDVDLKMESVFQIGSMTKQFTAIAILLLSERGKLEMTDPINKFLINYPNGDSITVHHLLTHTSGIRDFTRLEGLNTIAKNDLKPSEVIDLFKNEPIGFAPGEKFEYNNSGYVILGHIIEIVSGDSYENFIKKEIFEKIGMQHSYYASDRNIIKNRAYGYHKKPYGYVNKTNISFTIPFASGALMSTVGDMHKWQNALTSNKIISEHSRNKAFQKNALKDGTYISYGYGWHIKSLDGSESWEHGGSIFGFKSMGVYLPETGIYVLGLSNCDCNSPTETVRNIAAVANHWD